MKECVIEHIVDEYGSIYEEKFKFDFEEIVEVIIDYGMFEKFDGTEVEKGFNHVKLVGHEGDLVNDHLMFVRISQSKDWDDFKTNPAEPKESYLKWLRELQLQQQAPMQENWCRVDQKIEELRMEL